MTRTWRLLIAALAASLTLAVPAADGWSREPRVSGLNQLVVIPPGAHERGLPAVQADPLEGGGFVIDIPPTLHVHRYYYSGDQEYQGPILQGGPTVVVANHPKCGERMYIEVTLPPGAPVIAYSKTAITYVYPDSRIAIKFTNCHPDRVVINYHSGKGALRRSHEITEEALAKTKEHYAKSPVWQSLKDFGAGGGKLLAGGKQAVSTTASGLLDRAKQVGGLLPGASAVGSLAEQSAERANQAMIRGADKIKERASTEFLPTNR